MKKKERDWKMIIGMTILIVVFCIIGFFFWNTVAKQAELVKEEEKKAEEEAIVAIYMVMGDILKQPVFVDTDTKTIFTAEIPEEGIYNKKGVLVEGDVLEIGDVVKIYGDGQPVFVDTDTKTIFTAEIPEEGIYNKKGVLVEGDVLEIGDVVKIYGDGRMTYSMPGQYPGVTKMKRVRRASLEEAEEYKKIIQEALQ